MHNSADFAQCSLPLLLYPNAAPYLTYDTMAVHTLLPYSHNNTGIMSE